MLYSTLLVANQKEAEGLLLPDVPQRHQASFGSAALCVLICQSRCRLLGAKAHDYWLGRRLRSQLTAPAAPSGSTYPSASSCFCPERVARFYFDVTPPLSLAAAWGQGTPKDEMAVATSRSIEPLSDIADVVDAAPYLESGGFVTGEILHVDGGQAAGH